MNREPTFDQGAIEDRLHELAEHLEASTTVCLIGGGALTLRGLKNATRDIDLIVESTEAAERVFDALTEQGYRPIDEPKVEYTDLDAAFILERDPRRFDVFNRQVAGVIHLSEAMKGRSEELLVDGNLTVEMVSLDDIFLFKSVANRANDVDDMIAIAEAGFDVDGIMDEVSRQLEFLGEDHFIGAMKAKLDRLEKRDTHSISRIESNRYTIPLRKPTRSRMCCSRSTTPSIATTTCSWVCHVIGSENGSTATSNLKKPSTGSNAPTGSI